jgi:UDP:flavonoid glycosyltransferase YjiC (YdhE family)
LAQIAAALRGNGHDVTLVVGTTVEETPTPDITVPPPPVPAHREPGRPDFRRRLDGFRPSWVRGRNEILETFVDPVRRQAGTLSRLVHPGPIGRPFDAIVADVSYLGVQPLLLTTPRRLRPPVIGISTTPIMLRSADCAPFGAALPPWPGPAGERRNRQTDWLLRKGPLRPVRRALDAVAAEWDIGPGELDLFDAISRFDRVFQLGLPELEYPRRELPSFVDFVGPLPAHCRCGGLDHPEIDAGRRVVHITQGTLDNHDLSRLLLPSIRALADSGATVIASTGGGHADVRARFRTDPRIRMVDFVCYDWLLPRSDLMITNGGYGGVQLAARHGIPLIVAGDTQDKAEVGARVRWSGIGIDLRTGRPRHRRIGAAIRAIRRDRRYARRAAEIARSAGRLGDPLDRIIAGVLAQL